MAAELIQNAKKIYIVGIRSCEPLADFLGFYLNMLFDESMWYGPTVPAKF